MRVLRLVLPPLAIFLLWNVVGGLALFNLPAWLGLPIAALLFWWVIERFLLGAGNRAERAVQIRLLPLPPTALGWTLAAIPVLLVLSWSLGELYLNLVPVPAEKLNPYAPLFADPGSRLLLSVFAVAAAPVLEELVFRGAIQSRLVPLMGATAAILFAALLFAIVHFQPWLLPLHLFLGAAFGWAVLATGSVWAGIVLHTANNVAAMLTFGVAGDPERAPTIWEVGPHPELWATASTFLLAAGAAFLVGRKMWRAGHGRGAALAEPEVDAPQ